MKANNKVYMLVMRFHKNYANGNYEKENSGVLYYSMEDALEALCNYMESELWYFKNEDYSMEKVGTKELLYEMHSGKCGCELFINEYSNRRERFFSQKALYERFQEVITTPDENLYDNLLALVDHQRYYLNSFGEITRVVTIPQKINGKVVGSGRFTREDCHSDCYGGDFKYWNGSASEEERPYDGKLYFASGNILRKNIDEKDKTGWERYKECFYSEEEALHGTLSFWENKMEEYVREGMGSASHDYLKEISRKYVMKNIISVCVVSPERKQLKTLKELKKYYSENMLKVKKENRYDFLLSLVRYDERYYDEDGNYLRSYNRHQFLEDEYTYQLLPLFSKECVDRLKYDVKLEKRKE